MGERVEPREAGVFRAGREIEAWMRRGRALGEVPNRGMGGALIKAAMTTAIRDLEERPLRYWLARPDEWALQVRNLMSGVRHFERDPAAGAAGPAAE